MNPVIKICGLNTESAVNAAAALGASYGGFVHYPRSARHLEVSEMARLKLLLLPSVKSVAVVVDPHDSLLSEIANKMEPDFFQLHGTEDISRVRAIREKFPHIGIIKAVAVGSAGDVEKAKGFYNEVDFILFDAKPGAGMMHGGNGVAFDWSLLSAYKGGKWILSGGLNSQNIAQAIKITGAEFVDVSSGVESEPGVKNIGLIEDFIRAANGN